MNKLLLDFEIYYTSITSNKSIKFENIIKATQISDLANGTSESQLVTNKC